MPDSGTLTVLVGEHQATNLIAAHLGRDLGDGLAIRVRDDINRNDVGAITIDERGERVPLRHLPAAAVTNPDVNLGVVGWISGPDLHDELTLADHLGHRFRHRLTVDPSHFAYGTGPVRRAMATGIDGVTGADAVCDPGGLAVHARDSVLRAGGHVLIEAYGSPIALLDALAFVGLPPWTPYVDDLNLIVAVHTADGDSVEAVADRAAAAVLANGGPIERLSVAITGTEYLIPGVVGEHAGRSIAQAAGGTAYTLLGNLGIAVRRASGSEVLMYGTSDRTVLDLR